MVLITTVQIQFDCNANSALGHLHSTMSLQQRRFLSRDFNHVNLKK